MSTSVHATHGNNAAVQIVQSRDFTIECNGRNNGPIIY